MVTGQTHLILSTHITFLVVSFHSIHHTLSSDSQSLKILSTSSVLTVYTVFLSLSPIAKKAY